MQHAFLIELEDKPGALADITEAIAAKGVNITSVSGATCGEKGRIALETEDNAQTRAALTELQLTFEQKEITSTTMKNVPTQSSMVPSATVSLLNHTTQADPACAEAAQSTITTFLASVEAPASRLQPATSGSANGSWNCFGFNGEVRLDDGTTYEYYVTALNADLSIESVPSASASAQPSGAVVLEVTVVTDKTTHHKGGAEPASTAPASTAPASTSPASTSPASASPLCPSALILLTPSRLPALSSPAPS